MIKSKIDNDSAINKTSNEAVPTTNTQQHVTSIPSDLITLKEAARDYPRSIQTIRSWKKKGLFSIYGKNAKGANLVSRSEIESILVKKRIEFEPYAKRINDQRDKSSQPNIQRVTPQAGTSTATKVDTHTPLDTQPDRKMDTHPNTKTNQKMKPQTNKQEQKKDKMLQKNTEKNKPSKLKLKSQRSKKYTYPRLKHPKNRSERRCLASRLRDAWNYLGLEDRTKLLREFCSNHKRETEINY